jgi:hypothetical protein
VQGGAPYWQKNIWTKKAFQKFILPSFNIFACMSLQPIAHIDEILDRIFVYLDTPTLVHRIRLVCKQWERVSDAHIDYEPAGCKLPVIIKAASEGHLAAVNKLLQVPRIDPSVDRNYAVRWAS